MASRDPMVMIANLRNLAENGATQDERDNAQEKLLACMARYAIDGAMLDGAREKPQEIVEVTFEYTGIFRRVNAGLPHAVAGVMGCRSISTKYEKSNGFARNVEVVAVAGFSDDIDQIKTLVVSLDLQMAMAIKQWEKIPDVKASLAESSGMDKYKDRREFRAGFIAGVRTKMRRARDVAAGDAAAQRASESNGSASDATASVALALRTRADNVNDWVDTRYGKLRSRATRRSVGSYSASAAGHAAGRDADTGATRVGGSGRALGHGNA